MTFANFSEPLFSRAFVSGYIALNKSGNSSCGFTYSNVIRPRFRKMFLQYSIVINKCSTFYDDISARIR